MRRYSQSFTYTLMIYGVLFGAVFLVTNIKHSFVTQQQEALVTIHMVQATKSQPTTPTKSIKEDVSNQANTHNVPAIPEVAISNTPSLQPVKEPILKPEIEVKPLVSTPVLVSNNPPQESKAVQKIQTVNPIETTQNKPTQTVQEKPILAPKIITKTTIDTKAIKEQFYAALKAKIKQNQIYPLSAKRRGIQGIVEVKFVILPTGKVDNIEILSGNGVFKQSAIEAIENSFPMTIPQLLQNELKEVNLKLEYLIV